MRKKKALCAVLSAWTLALAAALIALTVDVHLNQPAFTRELAAERLGWLAVPAGIWLALAVAGWILRTGPVARLSDVDPEVPLRDVPARVRRIWMACGIVCAVCLCAAAVTLADARRFDSWDADGVTARLLAAVAPWLAVALAAGIFGACTTRIAPARRPSDGRRILAARILTGAAAVALVAMGAANGGVQDVLRKAINICTECIGLG